jgi:hypothetical protein
MDGCATTANQPRQFRTISPGAPYVLSRNATLVSSSRLSCARLQFAVHPASPPKMRNRRQDGPPGRSTCRPIRKVLHRAVFGPMTKAAIEAVRKVAARSAHQDWAAVRYLSNGAKLAERLESAVPVTAPRLMVAAVLSWGP